MKIQEIDSMNACRTNTGRARLNNGHYDLPLLATISGVRPLEDTLNDLQWCAENGQDVLAVQTITMLAESLLSAYEIQSQTYKK